jgi:uncharacterized membrane protein
MDDSLFGLLIGAVVIIIGIVLIIIGLKKDESTSGEYIGGGIFLIVIALAVLLDIPL